MTDSGRHGTTGTGFCRDPRGSQSEARPGPVPHRRCWTTSTSSLRSFHPSLFLFPFSIHPQSFLLYFFRQIRLARLLPRPHSSLDSQNVWSCCFLRHRQGVQRRMLFPSQPCVIFPGNQQHHQINHHNSKKKAQFVAKRSRKC